VLGGGNSKYLCMYDLRFRVLVKKYIVSNNNSLDGMKLRINYNE